MGNRVFVLGAGASYGAGFPLANDLFSRIYERLSPDAQRDLDRAVRYFYPFSKPTRSTSVSLRRVNIEELMSLLDAAEEFNEILPTTFMTPVELRKLRTHLLHSLVDLFRELQDRAEKASKYIGYVEAFVSKLRGADTIITFNWDTLVERQISQDGRFQPDYCPRGSSASGLPVLKLHGSVDWYHGAELASRAGMLPVHRQIFRTGSSRPSSRRRAQLASALPFIVPPTFYKRLRGYSDLEEVWATAFDRLRTADEIFICGYRFPPEDLLARFLVRRAIRMNLLQRDRKGKDKLRLLIVNPEQSVAKFVKENIDTSVRAEYARFEESTLVRR